MTLTEIDVKGLVGKLTEIEGVRVYSLDENEGTFMLGMDLPDGVHELTARINVRQDDAYFDVKITPPITPPSYLRVERVFMDYDLQPPSVP
ncbi:MAG: hypothetical protein V1645_03755 [archaeon]